MAHPRKEKMVEPKTWDEFRDTGLLTITNQILHIFGWAIVVQYDIKGDVKSAYPARVKFRGFDGASTINAYKKISKYMVENAETLFEESKKD